MVWAICASVGGVRISRPGRPTEARRKSELSPFCLLKASMAWARNDAGTGAPLSELRSDRRIVGDKGVHQLERDDLFAALVLLEPVQAEIIEAVPDRRRTARRRRPDAAESRDRIATA